MEAQVCVKGDKSYFKDGNEFRFTLEWVAAGQDINKERHGVEAIYVPISGGKFDLSKFEGKLTTHNWAKKNLADYTYQYFSKWPKSTSWLWTGSSEFKVDTSLSKLSADQGCIDFTRPTVIKSADATENFQTGKTYSMALSWAVVPASSDQPTAVRGVKASSNTGPQPQNIAVEVIPPKPAKGAVKTCPTTSSGGGLLGMSLPMTIGIACAAVVFLLIVGICIYCYCCKSDLEDEEK